MTDNKWWNIVIWCKWCNGEGYTTDNDPSKREEVCRECEGIGEHTYVEEEWRYEDEQEVRDNYEDIKSIKLLEGTSWGSPTLSME
jgi:DnaJ-class molecular chaperone